MINRCDAHKLAGKTTVPLLLRASVCFSRRRDLALSEIENEIESRADLADNGTLPAAAIKWEWQRA